jgi:hypothetical protein
MPKLAKPSSTAPQEFIDHPNELLQAILKAVGTLKPGERLELRRVRDPHYEPARSAKKKPGKPKAAAPRTFRSPKAPRTLRSPKAGALTSRTRKALRKGAR